MNNFCLLYRDLDATRSSIQKVEILYEFFKKQEAIENAWALFFLTGRKLKKVLKSSELRQLLQKKCELPHWLVEESYAAVGDLAECVSLLWPARRESGNQSLSRWVNDWAQKIQTAQRSERLDRFEHYLDQLSSFEVFIFSKMITGGLRVGVSKKICIKALAQLSGLSEEIIMQRLLGDWPVSQEFFSELLKPESDYFDQNQKFYPFYLASPLEKNPETLGAARDWLFEWKWDGIRCQVIKREDSVFLWSRGEEILNDAFPELVEALREYSQSFVLDAELMSGCKNTVGSFQDLQKRLNRKKPSNKFCKENPCHLRVYDVLEFENQDLRQQDLRCRRQKLTEDLAGVFGEQSPLTMSESFEFSDWSSADKQRLLARQYGAEGFMLKRKSSVYLSGRVRGDWFKWKLEPHTMDAVMIYAQAGHGRRAGLYTDYSFALWQGTQLVPVAKAYSGLSDQEINELDAWIKKNTRERFGPVRSVNPELVFEIGFEGIAESKRHKSGVAVRFPRILRWRKDKKSEEADRLEGIKKLITTS